MSVSARRIDIFMRVCLRWSSDRTSRVVADI
jgi:hypothetical protein